MPLGQRCYVLSQLFFLIIIIENHILPFSTLIKVYATMPQKDQLRLLVVGVLQIWGTLFWKD